MRRIFMAEDNPGDVYMMDLALRESGVVFELEVASTGKQALAFLDGEAQCGGPPVSLILLDMNLPQHDGTEILRRVRAHPSLRTVPTLLFTSSDSPADRAKALRAGADGFIRKPSALADYRALGFTIKEMLDRKNSPDTRV